MRKSSPKFITKIRKIIMKYLLTSIWKDTNPLVAIIIYKLMFMTISGILFIMYATIFEGARVDFALGG